MSRRLTALLALFGLLAWPAAARDALRDPTRPYGVDSAPAVSAPGLRVSAIFVSDVRRVAVVNGHAVRIGDRVDGATVTSIDESTVGFDYQGHALRAELDAATIRE